MSTEIFIGRVKWFNNKTGYGFITVTDGKRSGNDIFVHHSAINVEGQYKYLVQGEYVEFAIVDTPSGKHECQASNVNGIKGGKLMCTTRHETNIARSNYPIFEKQKKYYNSFLIHFMIFTEHPIVYMQSQNEFSCISSKST